MDIIFLWSSDYYLSQGINGITDNLGIVFLKAITKNQFKLALKTKLAQLYLIDIESLNITGENKAKLTKEILTCIDSKNKNRVIFLTKFQRNVLGMLLHVNINIMDTRTTTVEILEKIIKNVIYGESKNNENYFIGNPSRPLSERERCILSFISSGKRAYTIAREMNIDYKTVQAHKLNVIKKFSFNNSTELYKALMWFEQ